MRRGGTRARERSAFDPILLRLKEIPPVERPKDEYYSSLNTLDHDSALGGYSQLEVLLVSSREGMFEKTKPTLVDASCCRAGGGKRRFEKTKPGA